MPLRSPKGEIPRRRLLDWRLWLAPFALGWGLALLALFPGFFVVGADGFLGLLGYLFLYATLLGVVGVMTILALVCFGSLLSAVRRITSRRS